MFIFNTKFIEFFVLSLFHLKKLNMGNLLYIIAVILVIAWLIGWRTYPNNNLIHILLVIAVVAVLLRVIRGGRV